MLTLGVEPHPLLEARAFVTRFPTSLRGMPAGTLVSLLTTEADVPVSGAERARAPIRDMLRLGGYKPTGRGKPASEYLARAVAGGALGSINVAVDACNVVSLHSGVPISVVDLARTHPPLSLRIAPSGSSYVFNQSGQSIDVSGLICLFDADGPCANAVKDSQRTKTHAGTEATLSILWGARSLGALVDRACAWYRELLSAAGAATEDVQLVSSPERTA